jgi:hypothetical protein
LKGTAKVRVQGAADPILGRLLKENGFDEPPLWKHRPQETRARMARWRALGEVRDGPVNAEKTEITDIGAATESPKQMALDLGASVVGCAELTSIMVAEGVDLRLYILSRRRRGLQRRPPWAARDRNGIYERLCAMRRDFHQIGRPHPVARLCGGCPSQRRR